MSYISLLNETNINTDILYSTELSASNLTITGSVTLPNNSLLLSYLKNGTSGYIIICNTSGVPTYTIISGNASISNTGVLTIGSGQVSNNMLVHPSFSLGGTTINLGDSITTISSLNITNNIYALYGTFTRGTSNIANPILSTPSITCGSGNNGVVLIESVTGWGTYLFQNGYDFYIDNGYSSSTSSTINIGTIYGQTMTIGKVGCILNLPGTIVTLNVTTGTFTNAIFTRGTSNIVTPHLSTPSIICGSGNNGVVLIESVTGWGSYLQQNNYDFYLDNGYSGSPSTINIGTIYGQTMTIGKVGCILNLPGTLNVPVQSIALNSLPYSPVSSSFYYLCSSGTGNAWTQSVNATYISAVAVSNLTFNITMIPTGIASFYGMNYSTSLSYNASSNTLTAQNITCTGLISGSAGLTISSGTITLPVNSIALNSLPYSPVGTYYLSSVGTVNGWTNSINATQISAVAVSSLTFNITMIPTGIASFYGMNYSTSLSYNASTNNLTAQTITCNSINNATSFSTTSPVNNMLATTSILIGNVFTPPTILFSGATTFNNTSPVVMSAGLTVTGAVSLPYTTTATMLNCNTYNGLNSTSSMSIGGGLNNISIPGSLTVGTSLTVPTNSIALNSLITTGATSGQVLSTNGAGLNTWTSSINIPGTIVCGNLTCNTGNVDSAYSYISQGTSSIVSTTVGLLTSIVNVPTVTLGTILGSGVGKDGCLTLYSTRPQTSTNTYGTFIQQNNGNTYIDNNSVNSSLNIGTIMQLQTINLGTNSSSVNVGDKPLFNMKRYLSPTFYMTGLTTTLTPLTSTIAPLTTISVTIIPRKLSSYIKLTFTSALNYAATLGQIWFSVGSLSLLGVYQTDLTGGATGGMCLISLSTYQCASFSYMFLISDRYTTLPANIAFVVTARYSGGTGHTVGYSIGGSNVCFTAEELIQ